MWAHPYHSASNNKGSMKLPDSSDSITWSIQCGNTAHTLQQTSGKWEKPRWGCLHYVHQCSVPIWLVGPHSWSCVRISSLSAENRYLHFCWFWEHPSCVKQVGQIAEVSRGTLTQHGRWMVFYSRYCQQVHKNISSLSNEKQVSPFLLIFTFMPHLIMNCFWHCV